MRNDPKMKKEAHHKQFIKNHDLAKQKKKRAGIKWIASYQPQKRLFLYP